MTAILPTAPTTGSGSDCQSDDMPFEAAQQAQRRFFAVDDEIVPIYLIDEARASPDYIRASPRQLRTIRDHRQRSSQPDTPAPHNQ